MKMNILICSVLFAVVPAVYAKRYTNDWASIDSRPLPSWYDEAKIGIFIHWGVFSVPSFGSEWFWYTWQQSAPDSPYRQFMKDNFKPDFAYADFASQFTAEFFNPDQWADLFRDSGARYIVLTSKHHEGFCNWHTNVSFSWNSVEVGPHQDLVARLASSIRNRTDLVFGLYHSLLEWYNPLYLKDQSNKWQTQLFSLGKTIPELKELVNTYQPEVLWSDGNWVASDNYWGTKDFLAWLYNDSPVKATVVVNDRWCPSCNCKHGGYYTCNDRYDPGVLQNRKWENAMTLDKGSWGYRRNVDLSSYMSMDELIATLAETISCGGNILINVGPTKDGRIIPIFEERLRQLGKWLQVNGEAVYSSKPWLYQNDTMTPDIWYTQKSASAGSNVYVFVLNWPTDNQLVLGAPVATGSTEIHLLGYQNALKFSPGSSGIQIHFPYIPPNKMPCDHGWVLRLDGLKNGWREDNY